MSHRHLRAAREAGFTLIETLVAVVLVAVVLAFITPMIVSAVDSSRTADHRRIATDLAADELTSITERAFATVGFWRATHPTLGDELDVPVARTDSGSGVGGSITERTVLIDGIPPQGAMGRTVTKTENNLEFVATNYVTWTAGEEGGPQTSKRVTVQVVWGAPGETDTIDCQADGAPCLVLSRTLAAGPGDVDPITGDTPSAACDAPGQLCTAFVRSGRVLTGGTMALGDSSVTPIQSDDVTLSATTSTPATSVTASWSWRDASGEYRSVEVPLEALDATDMVWSAVVPRDRMQDENTTVRGDVRPGSVDVTFGAQFPGGQADTAVRTARWSFELSADLRAVEITSLASGAWCSALGPVEPVRIHVRGMSPGFDASGISPSTSDTLSVTFQVPGAAGRTTPVQVWASVDPATIERVQLETESGQALATGLVSADWLVDPPEVSSCDSRAISATLHRATDGSMTPALLRLPEASAPLSPTPTPEGVSLVVGTDGGTAAMWTVVEGADGYEVRFRIDDDPQSQVPATVNGWTGPVLARGQSLTVQVRASHDSAWSAWSAPVSSTFGVPAPGGLKVVTDQAKVTGTWSAVAGAVGYTVVLSEDGVARTIQTTDPGFETTSPDGATVAVTVTARTGSDTSLPTAPITVQVRPAAPPAPTVTWSVTGVWSATWPAVHGAGGYTTQWSTDGQSWAPVTTTIPQATGSAPLGSTLRVRVVAANSGGQSATSPVTTVEMVPGAVGQPAIVLNAGYTSWAASWPSVPGATGYLVATSTDAGATWDEWPVTSPSTSGALLPGERLMLRVAATAGPATGAWSSTVTITAPPDVPATPDLTIDDSSGVWSATWPAVPGADTYLAQWSADQGATWGSAPVTGTSASGSIGWGTEVRVRVASVAGSMTSTFSAPASVQRALAVPAALTLTTAPDGSWTASWSSVTGAQQYRAEVTVDGGSVVVEQPATSTSGVLNPGSALSVRVMAWSAQVESSWSAPVTWERPLAAPTGVGLEWTGQPADGGWEMTWDAVPGAQSYLVYRQTSSDGVTWTTHDPVSVLTPPLAGEHPPGTAVRLSVSTVSGLTESGLSAQVSLTRPPDLVVAELEYDAVTKSWVATWGPALGATSYQVQHSMDGGVTWTTAGVTGLTATGPMAPGQLVMVRVASVAQGVFSAFEATVPDMVATPPTEPVGPTAHVTRRQAAPTELTPSLSADLFTVTGGQATDVAAGVALTPSGTGPVTTSWSGWHELEGSTAGTLTVQVRSAATEDVTVVAGWREQGSPVQVWSSSPQGHTLAAGESATIVVSGWAIDPVAGITVGTWLDATGPVVIEGWSTTVTEADTAQVTWAPGVGAEASQVRWATDGGPWRSAQVVGSSLTAVLDPGDTTQVQVRSVAADMGGWWLAWSDWVDAQVTATAPPLAPTGATLTFDDATGAWTASWDAVPGASGYRVALSGDVTQTIDVTGTTASGTLGWGQTAWFHVSSVVDGIVGQFTPTDPPAVTRSLEDPPGGLEDLWLGVSSPGWVELQWTDPGDAEHVVIDLVTGDGTTVRQVVPAANWGWDDYVELDGSDTLTVTVRAVRGWDGSTWRIASDPQTLTWTKPILGAPSNLNLALSTSTWRATATWTAGANATYHQVRYRVGTGAWTQTDVYASSYLVPVTLTPGQTLEVEVAAVAWETTTAPVTGSVQRPAIAPPTNAQVNLTQSSGTWRVTWTTGVGASSTQTRYRVDGGAWSGWTTRTTNYLGSPTLANAQQLDVELRSVSGAYYSEVVSVTAQRYYQPYPVTGASLMASAGNPWSVSWTAGTSSDRTLVSYRLSDATGQSWSAWSAEQSVTGTLFTGPAALGAGVTIEVKLTAALGTVPSATVVTVSGQNGTPTPPGYPTSVWVDAIAVSYWEVWFTGAPGASYHEMELSGGDGTWTSLGQVVGGHLIYSTDAPTVRIRGVNGAGPGPWVQVSG